MANEEHLKILKQGVKTWNKWREENPEVTPDLSEANLTFADLFEWNPIHETTRADLSEANLSKAYLYGADLSGADLARADLSGADLTRADLSNAILAKAKLSNANLWEADLSSAILARADLGNANLWEADLSKANLSGANLSGANLSGASLVTADLTGIDLTRARLRDSDLQDAILKGARGLLGGQLAGSNVSGASLSEPILKFEGLSVIEETSKNARKIFISMLLGCLYTWLTIATTTDARLLTNSASSPLPIIGTEIPIVGFYWAAPLLLLGLYFYFHLYLERLWEGLADLPAHFPDGTPLDKKVYPWLLSGLVRAYVPLLKEMDRPPLSRLQVAISILLGWWAVPFTLVLFWGRYLPRHDWLGTSLHIALLVGSISSAILLQRLAAKTLQGERWEPLRWLAPWKDIRFYRRGALVLGVIICFYFLSLGAIEGVPSGIATEVAASTRTELGAYDVRMWVPQFLEAIGYRSVADLTEEDVSTKPENWTVEDNSQVKGAPLRDRDLRYARANCAFLAKADLRNANLEGANLYTANLRGANLEEANLRGANLEEADLASVNLTGSNLRGANLEGVNLWIITNYRRPITIASIRLANLYGVRNPPEGFLAWAIENGAVSLESDEEWEALKEETRAGLENTSP